MVLPRHAERACYINPTLQFSYRDDALAFCPVLFMLQSASVVGNARIGVPMSFARFLNAKSLLLAAPVLAAPLASCSFGPSRVAQPGINASRAGSLAIETYDKNGDGMVSGDELEHAPALKVRYAAP